MAASGAGRPTRPTTTWLSPASCRGLSPKPEVGFESATRLRRLMGSTSRRAATAESGEAMLLVAKMSKTVMSESLYV